MIEDLAAWLTQIWDEQEKAARQALDLSNAHIPTASAYVVEYVWSRQLLLDGAFQTAWTMPGAPPPSEVLARIAADRQILALHQPDRPRATEDDYWGDRKCPGCGWQLDVADGSTLDCPTVRLLALPHADRPGYQEAWRP
jgi:uncharacterized protein DUF6221